jgi:hypothetical protein
VAEKEAKKATDTWWPSKFGVLISKLVPQFARCKPGVQVGRKI